MNKTNVYFCLTYDNNKYFAEEIIKDNLKIDYGFDLFLQIDRETKYSLKGIFPNKKILYAWCDFYNGIIDRDRLRILLED